MNKVSYNLIMYQLNNKLSNKKFASILNFDLKTFKQMKKDNYKFNEEEINRISFITGIKNPENEIHEKINLKDKKIYGADFLNVRYEVISYQSQKIGLISFIVDIIFLVMLLLFILTKQFDLTKDVDSLNVLRIICIIEVCVFPFMYIVLPLLKIYYNRTYKAILDYPLKDEYVDEAKGIVYGYLRRSINKSLIPHLFTIFSEGVLAIYSLIYLNLENVKNKNSYIILIILFIISLINSIYTFTFYFGKKQHQILRRQ